MKEIKKLLQEILQKLETPSEAIRRHKEQAVKDLAYNELVSPIYARALKFRKAQIDANVALFEFEPFEVTWQEFDLLCDNRHLEGANPEMMMGMRIEIIDAAGGGGR